jgi:hypothetical protein
VIIFSLVLPSPSVSGSKNRSIFFHPPAAPRKFAAWIDDDVHLLALMLVRSPVVFFPPTRRDLASDTGTLHLQPRSPSYFHAFSTHSFLSSLHQFLLGTFPTARIIIQPARLNCSTAPRFLIQPSLRICVHPVRCLALFLLPYRQRVALSPLGLQR